MKVKIMSIAQYKGHRLDDNGSVNLNFKFKYDQLVKVVQLTQMLNNDVKIFVKLPDVNNLELGMFRIKSIMIDNDGESVVKLNGLNDYIEVNHLNDIVTKELFKIRFESEIELEGGEED